MTDNRLAMLETRFQTLLLKWLAKVPLAGWEGTSKQSGDELYSLNKGQGRYAHVPISAGKKVIGMRAFITAHGFTLVHRRNKHTRTLRFTTGMIPPLRDG
jgi:hypothetical protein